MFVEHKTLTFIAVGAFVLLVLLGLTLWWALRLKADQPEAVAPPIKFEYCSAELETLCVLSFGRDGDGNTIINLFAPKGDLPVFYLKVSRVTGESIYECDRLEDAPTTVYCIGEAINLNERFEIHVISKQDDRLLAVGKFTLTAVLLVPDVSQQSTPQPASTEFLTRSTRTPTITPSAGPTLAVTPTPTSDSYPGPTSYP